MAEAHLPERLGREWLVACASREIGRHPLARTVLGRPLVLFRGSDGVVGALEDRCPHRNVPLSAGRVTSAGLECLYHGWTFARDGACVAIPCRAPGAAAGAGRAATALAAAEVDGYVWVVAEAGAAAAAAPPAAVPLGPREWRYRYAALLPGALDAVLENVLNVPHTAFLHRGLFRGRRAPLAVTAHVRRGADRIEVEYRGEPRPPGLIARLLAPGGGEVTHVDRFVYPASAEVEYALGTSRLVATSLLTPESEEATRLHAELRVRTGIPRVFLAPLLLPLAALVLRQDARILRLQRDNLRRFGGRRLASTELDLFAGEVARLLRDGPEGAAATAGERRVELRV